MPDDGSCAVKHVALCYMILKCCVGRCISFVCDTVKHVGIYRNTIPVTALVQPALDVPTTTERAECTESRDFRRTQTIVPQYAVHRPGSENKTSKV